MLRRRIQRLPQERTGRYGAQDTPADFFREQTRSNFQAAAISIPLAISPSAGAVQRSAVTARGKKKAVVENSARGYPYHGYYTTPAAVL